MKLKRVIVCLAAAISVILFPVRLFCLLPRSLCLLLGGQTREPERGQIAKFSSPLIKVKLYR